MTNLDSSLRAMLGNRSTDISTLPADFADLASLDVLAGGAAAVVAAVVGLTVAVSHRGKTGHRRRAAGEDDRRRRRVRAIGQREAMISLSGPGTSAAQLTKILASAHWAPNVSDIKTWFAGTALLP